MLPTHLPGMLRRDEVVERYARQSGTESGDFRYYYVYGLFRLAVIVQQIWYRYVRGETRNPRFATFGACCTVLSRAAEAAAGGAMGSPA
jgi:aminoglycoside phosphotransferase (APT) family kinase protein